MLIEIVSSDTPKPVRPARNNTDIVSRARLKRWLDAQVSPFARLHAQRSRQSASKPQQAA